MAFALFIKLNKVGIILFMWLKLCIKQKYSAKANKGGENEIIKMIGNINFK